MAERRAHVAGIASYVPAGRLAVSELRRAWPGVATPGGVKAVSVAGFDEDVVTLGVEAVDALLELTGVDPDEVDALWVATCSSPYAEHSAAAEVARALGLPRGAGLHDLAGSTLGGVGALVAAADAVVAGRVHRALVVAADSRRGEPGSPVEAFGAAAVAVLVTDAGPAVLGRSVSHRHGVPTRWRAADSQAVHAFDDSRYETTLQVTPAVRAVVSGLGADGWCGLGPLDARAAAAVAKGAGIAGDTGTAEVAAVGDTGTAAPLLALAACLSDAGPSIGAVVAVAPGTGSLGVAVEVTAAVPVAARRPAETAVDYLGWLRRHGVVSAAAPPEQIVSWPATPAALRADSDLGFDGNRCQQCKSLNVPARPMCVDCGATSLTPARAPRRGTIVTHNVQHVVAVHPEPSPVAVAVVRLDGEGGARGGQISTMLTDSDLAALHVGSEVDVVYRRQGVEDGQPKYGWKARLR